MPNSHRGASLPIHGAETSRPGTLNEDIGVGVGVGVLVLPSPLWRPFLLPPKQIATWGGGPTIFNKSALPRW